MGLIEAASNTGTFPGATDSAFVARCLAFLQEQISTQRPRLILTLGAHVPRHLAQLSADLKGWQNVKSLREIDRTGSAKISAVRFQSTDPPAPAIEATVLALTHPAQRPLNISRRFYGTHVGHDAELAMLNEALLETGLLES